jgi:hypothetical protein
MSERGARPWWRKKTNLGAAVILASGALKVASYFVASPLREALDAASTTIYAMGTALGIYGVADRVSHANEES